MYIICAPCPWPFQYTCNHVCHQRKTKMKLKWRYDDGVKYRFKERSGWLLPWHVYWSTYSSVLFTSRLIILLKDHGLSGILRQNATNFKLNIPLIYRKKTLK